MSFFRYQFSVLTFVPGDETAFAFSGNLENRDSHPAFFLVSHLYSTSSENAIALKESSPRGNFRQIKTCRNRELVGRPQAIDRHRRRLFRKADNIPSFSYVKRHFVFRIDLADPHNPSRTDPISLGDITKRIGRGISQSRYSTYWMRVTSVDLLP